MFLFRRVESRLRRRDLALDQGFTLIELLVVVIVIGVLAAIAVPVYLGVQNSAKDAGLKSDLVGAKKALTAYVVSTNGTPPAESGFDPSRAGLDLVRSGWTQSPSTVSLTYSTQGTGASTTWCVLGVSTTGKRFAISSSTQVTGGTATSTCPASY